jgi:copper(I)-binding protein
MMKRFVRIAVLMMLMSGGFVFAQTAQPRQKPAAGAVKGAKVSGTACVRAGVEGGCIMLVTTDGKNTYNVVGSKQPKAGTVVRFTGTTDPGTTTLCMQGTPVKLTTFTAVRMKCPLEGPKTQ